MPKLKVNDAGLYSSAPSVLPGAQTKGQRRWTLRFLAIRPAWTPRLLPRRVCCRVSRQKVSGAALYGSSPSVLPGAQTKGQRRWTLRFLALRPAWTLRLLPRRLSRRVPTQKVNSKDGGFLLPPYRGAAHTGWS